MSGPASIKRFPTNEASAGGSGDMSAADKTKLDTAPDDIGAAITAAGAEEIANDVDPTVSPGLAGRCGKEVVTADGSKSWKHGAPVTDADTPDTNWFPIHST